MGRNNEYAIGWRETRKPVQVRSIPECERREVPADSDDMPASVHNSVRHCAPRGQRRTQPPRKRHATERVPYDQPDSAG
jgi:hypothetical protein